MKKILKGYLLGFLTAVLVIGGTAYGASAIKIVIDGKEIIPKDINGNIVDPIIIDGTTYIPARAVANALNCLVSWDAETSTVQIMSGDYYVNYIKPTINIYGREYYPNTSIPTYTGVTGVQLLKTESYNNINTHIYTLSDKVVDYTKVLIDEGWELYDTEKTDEYTTYYIVKGEEMIDVSLMYAYNQLWISY